MNNLLNFLKRYSSVFVFIILEMIAISLIIKGDVRTRTFYINSSNYITGSIYNYIYKYYEYLKYDKINKNLIEENANLHIELSECKEKIAHTKEKNILSDTSTKFIVADVIKNSVFNKNNLMTINAGKKDGVKSELAVISSKGVVGVVVSASNNYAIVLSLLNIRTGIGAKIKSSGHWGSLEWNGKDYRYSTLKGIPNHIKIKKGDTVVTSGYSLIFPEGIPIGKIESYKKNSSDNFFNIKVKLFVDFKSLNKVYVIDNKKIDEIRQLNDSIKTKF